MHASVAAGGTGHRHAYQCAAAALCDGFERVLIQRDDTPARVALTAHIRATYIYRAGVDGEREDARVAPAAYNGGAVG